MKILQRQNNFAAVVNKILSKKRKLAWLSVTIIVLSSTFLMGILFQWAELPKTIYVKAKLEIVNLRLLFPNEHQPNQLVIDISFKNMERLAATRQRVINQNIGTFTDDDWASANVRFRGDEIQAKVRVKGAIRDHWQNAYQVSLRMNLKKGSNAINGMRRMVIQPSEQRGDLMEWLFQKILEREEMIAHRLEFVNLVANGENLGIWALQEQYGKELIENSRRRNGPIVGFSKDLLFSGEIWRGFSDELWILDSFWKAPVSASQLGQYVVGSPFSDERLAAFKLLNGFRQGIYDVEDVFDLKQIAKYFAIKLLFGAEEMDWRDIRFYVNPITTKLEPIGREVHHGEIRKNHTTADRSQAYWGLPYIRAKRSLDNDPFLDKERGGGFVELFYKDKQFIEAYVRELEQISQKQYLDTLFHEISEELQRNEKLLQIGRNYSFNQNILYSNQRHIKDALNPPQVLHAYLIKKIDDRAVFRAGNIQPFPVSILGIGIEGGVSHDLPEEIYLPGKQPGVPVSYFEFSTNLPPKYNVTEENLEAVTIIHKLSGASDVREIPLSLFLYHRLGKEYFDVFHVPPNAAEQPFVKVDFQRKEYQILPGNWRIKQTTIFPSGFTVRAVPGTNLILEGGASLISFSPLIFQGTSGEPITIIGESTDSGIFVSSTEEPSFFEYTVFNGLSPPRHGPWNPTGAISFYEANVTLSHCKFLENRKGDDYLNIIRSNFVIESVKFFTAYADAVDIDFSEGKITNSLFVDIGNDAIDASGSNISIDTVELLGIGDKAVSAGEQSTITLKDLKIQESLIGIASKDLTEVEGRRISISNVKWPIAVYQKKSEFGGGRANLFDLEIHESGELLLESGSTLKVDGSLQDATVLEVMAVETSILPMNEVMKYPIRESVLGRKSFEHVTSNSFGKSDIVIDLISGKTTTSDVSAEYSVEEETVEHWLAEGISALRATFGENLSNNGGQ